MKIITQAASTASTMFSFLTSNVLTNHEKHTHQFVNRIFIRRCTSPPSRNKYTKEKNRHIGESMSSLMRIICSSCSTRSTNG